MKARGFTLIELMVTIAILAIIAAIAVPIYSGQVEKARRADAVSALMTAAQAFERCFTRSSDYTTCSVPTYNGGTDTSPDGYYNVTVDSASTTSTTYKLIATATGPQAGDDCSPFTVDHFGDKDDAGGTGDRCWGN